MNDDTQLTPTGHPTTLRYSPTRLLINPVLLKRAALLKTADFSLVTGEFAGDRVTFQPWLSLRTVQRDRIVSLGVYQPSFPRGDPDGDPDAGPPLPDVAWRRAEWDRFRDIDRFRAAPDKAAYLVGDTQIDSRICFGRLSEQPRLATVLAESIASLAAGVRMVAAARPDMEWESLRVSVLAEELGLNLDYSPWLAQCAELETWAGIWASLFESLDDTATIGADGDITVSYEDSYDDLVERVRRFPQPVIASFLAGASATPPRR